MFHRIQKISLLGVILALLLAACATPQVQQPATEPTQPAATQAPQSTVPLPEPTIEQPTAAPAEPTAVPPMEAAPTATMLSVPTEAPVVKGTAKAVLIALDDAGKSGPQIGCGDSEIVIDLPVSQTGNPYQDVLEALLGIKDQYYGESGLYNALYQADLKVDDAALDAAGKLTVQMSGSMMLGGVCDNPRAKAQLEDTLLQFPEVKQVEVLINGTPLDQLLSGRG